VIHSKQQEKGRGPGRAVRSVGQRDSADESKRTRNKTVWPGRDRAGRIVETGRTRRAESEQDRDFEFIAWIARFRFVTRSLLAKRFGVSEQQAGNRVSWLEHAGYVARAQRGTCQQEAIYITPKGCELLEIPRRKEPRADMQWKHEVAIAETVIWLELNAPDRLLEVLTERECRRREIDTGERFHVPAVGETARTEKASGKRWPDLVLVYADHRNAIEIEFSAKHRRRLERLLDGYRNSSRYRRVFYYVDSPPLARQIARHTRTHTPSRNPRLTSLTAGNTQVRVSPWFLADAQVRARVKAAIRDA